jgi:hypothetical protein
MLSFQKWRRVKLFCNELSQLPHSALFHIFPAEPRSHTRDTNPRVHDRKYPIISTLNTKTFANNDEVSSFTTVTIMEGLLTSKSKTRSINLLRRHLAFCETIFSAAFLSIERPNCTLNYFWKNPVTPKTKLTNPTQKYLADADKRR